MARLKIVLIMKRLKYFDKINLLVANVKIVHNYVNQFKFNLDY